MELIGACIFDKDGTVIDTEGSTEKARRKAIESFGGSADAYTTLLHNSLLGMNAEDMFRHVQAKTGITVGFKTFIALYREISQEILEKDGIKVIEGAICLIESLKRAGIKVAIATGAGKNSTALSLEKAGLSGIFDTIVTSDQVRRGKPYPDTFQKAAVDLGIRRLRCAVVGDGPNDIIAGKRAGMRTILFNPNAIQHTYPMGVLERPDHTVSRLTDAKRFLLPPVK